MHPSLQFRIVVMASMVAATGLVWLAVRRLKPAIAEVLAPWASAFAVIAWIGFEAVELGDGNGKGRFHGLAGMLVPIFAFAAGWLKDRAKFESSRPIGPRRPLIEISSRTYIGVANPGAASDW